jgi:hypothetical protein
VDYSKLGEYILAQKWSPESIGKWQDFYNNASRYLVYGDGVKFSSEYLPRLPEFKDLKPAECKRSIPSLAIRQHSFAFFTLIPFLTVIIKKVF